MKIFKLSEETRRKMSDARVGIRLSDATREKMRLSHIGVPHPCSPETRKKISEALNRFHKNNKN